MINNRHPTGSWRMVVSSDQQLGFLLSIFGGQVKAKKSYKPPDHELRSTPSQRSVRSKVNGVRRYFYRINFNK